MKIIGVTGGIGSGKSTVSRLLKEAGAEVIDADSIAREVVAKGEQALEELAGCFGNEILTKSGELDRKALSDKVFNDSKKLDILNKITHKYIIDRIIQKLDKFKADGKARLVVLDVPIPIEHGFLDTVDVVWVVYANRELRIRRVMERSSLSREEAERRMASQGTDEEYARIADILIMNEGSQEELKRQVEKLQKAILN